MKDKVKSKLSSNPYDVLRHLAGATHIEVQYFLPYLKAWLPSSDDQTLVDMDSVAIALLSYAVNGQLFVAGDKAYSN